MKTCAGCQQQRDPEEMFELNLAAGMGPSETYRSITRHPEKLCAKCLIKVMHKAHEAGRKVIDMLAANALGQLQETEDHDVESNVD